VTTATKSGPAIAAMRGDSTAMRFAVGAFWALVGAVVSRGTLMIVA